MKNQVKRLAIMLLALMCTLTVILPGKANASYQTTTPLSGNCVRIRYAGNGRYLDMPTESMSENGNQAQLWDKTESDFQNQIYYMEDTGNGWKIYPMSAPDKVLEVRDSSHQPCAEVAQWKDHDGACARWDIVPRGDGTVSFCNKESGLLLNVSGGGDAPNATDLIQYPEDGTIACRFYIEVMDYEDLRAAQYTESFSSIESQVKYDNEARVIGSVDNTTRFSVTKDGQKYYPRRGDQLFTGLTYLDADCALGYIDQIPASQREDFKHAVYCCGEGIAVYSYIRFEGTHISLGNDKTVFRITEKPYCVFRSWDKDETPLPPEATNGDWAYSFQ